MILFESLRDKVIEKIAIFFRWLKFDGGVTDGNVVSVEVVLLTGGAADTFVIDDLQDYLAVE